MCVDISHIIQWASNDVTKKESDSDGDVGNIQADSNAVKLLSECDCSIKYWNCGLPSTTH